jgi:predicted short-subunit dehydrogenase-like oxidoreductase (DUF2520 family)
MHASAVVASNYLVALIDAATKLAQRAGLSRRRAMEALGPLVRATVDNVLRLGPERALTGPIERGDVGTIRRHLSAIGPDRRLRRLYAALGAWTAGLAHRKGSISRPVANRIFAICHNPRR